MRYLPVFIALMLASPVFAQTNVGPFFIGFPGAGLHGDSESAGLVINASGEKVAVVFEVPMTGTIDSIGIQTGTVTVADELSVTIQTVATTGLPSGSNYGGSTEGIITTPASATTHLATLGTGATAVAGQQVAVVIEFDSFATGNLIISSMLMSTNTQLHPRVFHDSGSGLTIQTNRAPMIVLHYSGGGGTYKVPLGALPPCIITINNSIQSDTSPDEVGFQFTAPIGMRLIGSTWSLDEDGSTAELNFNVWDDSASPVSLLTNPTVFAMDQFGGGGTRTFGTLGMEPVTLAASDMVTVAVFSEDPSNNLTVTHADVSNAAYWGDFMPGIVWASRARNDDGTPTNAFTPLTTRKPLGGLWFDQITVGSSNVVDPLSGSIPGL